MFNILFESNINEANEFIKFYFNKKIFFVIIYYIIGFLTLFKMKKNIFLKTLILSIITIFLGVKILNIQGSTYFRKTYVLKSIHRSYTRYKKAVKETKKLMNSFDERFKDIKVNDSSEEATYVLVIGESFSKHHSSLYGYPRDTSPNMLKRKNNEEIFIFDDVVSPHHYTRDTLLKLVTEYSHDNDINFAESMNIIDLFKKAGYKTFWLSNQEDFAYNGAGLTAVANRADKVVFTEKSMSDTKIKAEDGILIPYINEALNDSSKKKFIVIHLFGSHAAYEHRYPKEFEYFSKNLDEKYFNDMQKENKKIVNEYHNALRYNDYLMEEIIESIDKNSKNSYLVYLSDHGQIVYDDNLNFVGNILPEQNIKSIEIPMLVWLSEDYKKNNLEKVKDIKDSKNKKYSSEDLLYLLVDLSNFNYSNHKEEKSLINKNFRAKDRKISNEGLIYEKENSHI